MFATFRKIFGLQAEEAVEAPSQPRPAATNYNGHSNGAAPVRNNPQPARPAASLHAPATLSIPLSSIIARLTGDLAQRVRQTDVGDAHVAVSTQKILSQMPQGTVKITYGELRQLAPTGTFSTESDRDRLLVEVPLSEILARLDHAFLARRPSQKQVFVPAEVMGPFGGQNQVLFSTASLKPSANAQVVQPQAAPVAPAVPPPAPTAPVMPPPIQRAPLAPVAPIVPQQPIAFKSPTPPPAPATPAPAAVRPPPPPPNPFVRPAQPAPTSPVLPAPTPRTTTPTPSPWAMPATGQKGDADDNLFKRVAPKPAATNGPTCPPIAPASTPTPAPAARFQPPPPPAPKPEPFRFTAPTPASVAPAPVAPVAPVAPIAPAPAPAIAAAPVAPIARIRPTAPAPVAPVASISPIAPAMPMATAPVIAPITPIAPEAEPEPAPIPFQIAPEPVPEPEPAPVAAEAPPAPPQPVETRFLKVTVSELSASWPENVMQEVAAQHLASATVGLPFGVIEVAMKQGKIAVPWRVVRSWITPPVLTPTSPNDGVVLDLPLKAIAPLFLAELRGGSSRKKIEVDDNIPDLFSGAKLPENPVPAPAPQPAAPPMAAPAPAVLPSAKPSDTNYFAKLMNGDHGEEAAPSVKKGPTPGTAFLVRYATPNEIVSKAAALEGVDGALIALPDGLLVASHIPPTMNGDTIAAFLPQIFGRVSQCTKELRLGELNNLNFTVGAVPWKIFKVGAIYFAAFGRPGEPLPTAALAGIAAELDRKAK